MYCTEHCTYDLIPGTLLGAHGTAESSAPLVNSYLFLVNSYLIFGHLVPTRVNSYLFWSTRTYFGQLVPVFGQLVPFITQDRCVRLPEWTGTGRITGMDYRNGP